jgi:hypothetical protein
MNILMKKDTQIHRIDMFTHFHAAAWCGCPNICQHQCRHTLILMQTQHNLTLKIGPRCLDSGAIVFCQSAWNFCLGTILSTCMTGQYTLFVDLSLCFVAHVCSRCVIFCHVSILIQPCHTVSPSHTVPSFLSGSLFTASCCSLLGNLHFHTRKENSNPRDPANLYIWRCSNNELETRRNLQNAGRTT